ncbi:cobalt-precorrin-6A reductase [Roseofilum casamattae]|uniref:Cobalt-precorrin-6A reductase n=1 Tax=Roseofilum casamattae BLCC-M143 TaxID=3022442 RepID=A0ABT7BW56_9CYAN|nr:cobalt-precorrin-6A reductase [Roseofilum casamattae]MDJ1183416.1 cobalt-precorrin-6A reductase [Roseofilum casamattae BLCC-M143]
MKPSPNIWLIGGTSDSSTLARALVERGLSCIVTATTEDARSLYPNSDHLQLWVGKLDNRSMEEFARSHHIVAILDASHPFAATISQNAIAFAQHHNLPYLRYERPSLPKISDRPNHHTVESIDALLAGNYMTNQRVLLAIGYQSLPLFQPWHDRATLFARVLPSPQSVRVARDSGFTSDRLIALRPPVPEALEVSLWQHWRISLLVTKASGTAGGELTKRQTCDRLDIASITIARPKLDYPELTCDIAEAVARIGTLYISGKKRCNIFSS